MSVILTYWTYPKNGQNTPDDYDSILEVRIKSVKQILEFLAAMPKNCTMVSTEYSANHYRSAGKLSTPTNPRRFKEIWRKGQPFPVFTSMQKCPLCGK